MKIAIMQPYFFPYLGYFQLIKSVDKFILYDDVNYIKQGWINRNRILLNGKVFYLTLKLDGASSFKKINNIIILDDFEDLLKNIKQAYLKTHYFCNVFPFIERIFEYKDKDLARFITNLIREICDYMKIESEILLSSELKKNCELKGEEKIIHICKLMKSNYYINAIGGKDLYSKEKFFSNGIELKFINSISKPYKQYDNPFIQGLSILDVMMFNSREKISKMLYDYEII
jgi:hypothetical protein